MLRADFRTTFIRLFRKILLQNNVSFSKLYLISGLGREGEYAYGFNTNNWTENQKQSFLDGLKRITWKKQNSNSFGGISVSQNKQFELTDNGFQKVKKITIADFLH